MSHPRLTAKQEAFALAYLKTGNASESYKQAYDAKNMKPESIHVNASKLLKNTKVALRLVALNAPAVKSAMISAERTNARLAHIAYDLAPDDPVRWPDVINALDKCAKIAKQYGDDSAPKQPVNIDVTLTLVSCRPQL